MRIYVPATKADIEALVLGHQINPRTGFKNLPEWAAQQDESDEEVLEELLLYRAANQSQSGGRRIVLVIEESGQILDPETGEIAINNKFGKNAILAMFADDLANKRAILAGDNLENLDLTWFGPTEIAQISDFLGEG